MYFQSKRKVSVVIKLVLMENLMQELSSVDVFHCQLLSPWEKEKRKRKDEEKKLAICPFMHVALRTLTLVMNDSL